jgi:uncharacterized protein
VGRPGGFPSLRSRPMLSDYVAPVAGALVVVALYLLISRFLERRRTIPELGLTGSVSELGAGLAVGAVLILVSSAAIVMMGGYRLNGQSSMAFAGKALCLGIGAAVPEELVFRGLLFRLTEPWLGSWLTVALCASVFGLVHAVSGAASLLGAVAIAASGGVLLCAAFMFTRRLWFPIGMHLAFNVLAVLSFGLPGAPGFLRLTTPPGADWLTGGEDGPQSSLITVALCLAVAAYLLRASWRAARVIGPRWTGQEPQARPHKHVAREARVRAQDGPADSG